MELLHIHKDTWAAVGATALIPFYRLTDTDIILLDTGIAASDREGLTALLEEHGLRPKGSSAPTLTTTTWATPLISAGATAAPSPCP